MAALTLIEVFADVPDPRSPHGRFHPLPSVLSLVVLGLLMGRKSLSGIARFGRLYGAPLAWALGFRRGKTPTKSMLSELLRALDAEAFEAALSRWVFSRLEKPAEHVSLDGKALRGSREGAVPGQHLVAAYAPQAEAVLAQLRVDAKTNEHKAALQLLGLLPLAGTVVIGDAMFCQRDVADHVIAAGGDYILVAKENQPRLRADVAAGFGFEAAARSIEAAFSPSDMCSNTGSNRTQRPVRRKRFAHASGHNRGERPWPRRETHAPDNDRADAPRTLDGHVARL